MYESIGVDEMIFMPCSTDQEQVNWVTEAALL
jgi:hypothetical protein